MSRFREYLRINTISVPTPNSSGPQPDYGMRLGWPSDWVESSQWHQYSVQLMYTGLFPKPEERRRDLGMRLMVVASLVPRLLLVFQKAGNGPGDKAK